MAHKSKIQPETQDNPDLTTAADLQAKSKARRGRRMVREAMGSANAAAAAVSGAEQQSSAAVAALDTARRPTSKIAGVIALLERNEGATLAELVEATGWLPHTTRAALTGLKKKGRTIARHKRGEVTCYRIEASA